MAEKQTTEKQSTFKELVLPVIVLVVISAPAVKEKISSLGKSLRKQREVA